jgi:hypothetical protein
MGQSNNLLTATVLIAASTDGFRLPSSWELPHRRPFLTAQPSHFVMLDAAPLPRPPYMLSKESRPRWRGKCYGVLHRTGAWYGLVIAYLAAVAVLLSRGAHQGAVLCFSLRVFHAISTSLNVWLSNGFHNPDKRAPGDPCTAVVGYMPILCAVWSRSLSQVCVCLDSSGALSEAAETRWLKADFVGISLVLSCSLWLWSANAGLPRDGLALARYRVALGRGCGCGWTSSSLSLQMQTLSLLLSPYCQS